MNRKKITVVGAGNVGATCAQRLAERDYADVVLVDIVEGLPQGKALDLNQSGPVVGYEAQVVGTNGYEETAGSSICVITSGIARKPGMSRDDLLTTNQKIVGDVARELVKHSPDTILITVKDNGIGLSPETLSDVFELFSQVDKSLDRTRGGLGIDSPVIEFRVDDAACRRRRRCGAELKPRGWIACQSGQKLEQAFLPAGLTGDDFQREAVVTAD